MKTSEVVRLLTAIHDEDLNADDSRDKEKCEAVREAMRAVEELHDTGGPLLCPVCDRPFTELSGNSTGCAAHGMGGGYQADRPALASTPHTCTIKGCTLGSWVNHA